MKALSIKQPWASLIAQGIKDIENRTWKTNYRGRIFIHASAKSVEVEFSNEQSAQLWLNGFDQTTIISKDKIFPNSAIIGEVDIIDCVVNHESIWAEKTLMPAGVYVGEKPIYNWVLANPVLYDKPFLNIKGKLSFWEPDIEISEYIK